MHLDLCQGWGEDVSARTLATLLAYERICTILERRLGGHQHYANTKPHNHVQHQTKQKNILYEINTIGKP